MELKTVAIAGLIFGIAICGLAYYLMNLPL